MPELLTEQAIGAAKSVIGGMIVKDVIDHAKEALDELIDNTSIRFSNVGQDLIAQLNISIESLVNQMR